MDREVHWQGFFGLFAIASAVASVPGYFLGSRYLLGVGHGLGVAAVLVFLAALEARRGR